MGEVGWLLLGEGCVIRVVGGHAGEGEFGQPTEGAGDVEVGPGREAQMAPRAGGLREDALPVLRHGGLQIGLVAGDKQGDVGGAWTLTRSNQGMSPSREAGLATS